MDNHQTAVHTSAETRNVTPEYLGKYNFWNLVWDKKNQLKPKLIVTFNCFKIDRSDV